MSDRLVRRWEGRPPRSNLDAWLDGYRRRVLPLMKGIDGCLGAAVHVERDREPATVTVLTYWDVPGALNRFAGPDIGSAVMQDWVTDPIPDCDDFATDCDQVLAEDFR